MSIAAAITQQLLATDPVTNLIEQRLYPQYNYQTMKVYPLAVYRVENVSPLICNDAPTGFETADYVVDCLGEKFADADAVADAIQTALDGARGTWSGMDIQGIFMKEDGRHSDTLSEPQTEQILYFIQTLTFNVAYSNS